MKNKLIVSIMIITAMLSLTLTTRAMALSDLTYISPASAFDSFTNPVLAYGYSTIGGVTAAYAGKDYRGIEFCDNQLSRSLIDFMELNPASSRIAPRRYLVGGVGLCGSSATSLIADDSSLYYIRTGPGSRTVVERINRLSPSPVTPSLEIDEAATSLTQSGGSLFWTTGNLLRSQPKRAVNVNIPVVSETLYPAPTGSLLRIVAQDATQLFFVETPPIGIGGQEMLRKIPLNGGVSTILQRGRLIGGVAVDGEKIYWNDFQVYSVLWRTQIHQLIYSASKSDGSNKTLLYSINNRQIHISNLVVTSNKLYWIESTGSDGFLRSISNPISAIRNDAPEIEAANGGSFNGLRSVRDTYWSGTQMVIRDRLYFTHNRLNPYSPISVVRANR